LMVRTAFTRALKAVPGVEKDTQRSSGSRRLQFVVTYGGSEPLDQALATNLSHDPAFTNLDSRSEGNHVVLCMGPCTEAEDAASGTER